MENKYYSLFYSTDVHLKDSQTPLHLEGYILAEGNIAGIYNIYLDTIYKKLQQQPDTKDQEYHTRTVCYTLMEVTNDEFKQMHVYWESRNSGRNTDGEQHQDSDMSVSDKQQTAE